MPLFGMLVFMPTYYRPEPADRPVPRPPVPRPPIEREQQGGSAGPGPVSSGGPRPGASIQSAPRGGSHQEILDMLGINRDGTRKQPMPRQPMPRQALPSRIPSDRLRRMADNLNAGRLVYYPPEIRQQMFDLGLIGEEHLDTGPKILPYDTRQPIKPIPMVDGRSPAFLASNNSAALAALLRRLYSE